MNEQKDEKPKDDRYSYLIRGKSDLQKRLEKELAEKQAAHEEIYGKPERRARKSLKWYWWVAIAAGLAVWTVISFTTYNWEA